MAKFHINPDTGEVGACRSTQGKCPFGAADAHFETQALAARAAEERMAAQEGNLPVSKRKATVLETVVPEPVFEAVEHEVRATAVKVGDRLLSRGEAEVLGASVGRKYVAFTIADPKKGERSVHVPLGDSVAVRSQRETEASVEARKVARAEANHENLIKHYKAEEEVAVRAIREGLAAGQAPTAPVLDQLAEAKAHDKVAEEYSAAVREAKERGEALPYTAAAEALKGVYNAELVRAAAGLEAKPSSPALDLFARAATTAKAEFVRWGTETFL